MFEGQEEKDSGRVRSAKGVRARRKGNFFPPGECKNPDWSVIRTCQSAALIPYSDWLKITSRYVSELIDLSVLNHWIHDE